jgi:hypothetical protein
VPVLLGATVIDDSAKGGPAALLAGVKDEEVRGHVSVYADWARQGAMIVCLPSAHVRVHVRVKHTQQTRVCMCVCVSGGGAAGGPHGLAPGRDFAPGASPCRAKRAHTRTRVPCQTRSYTEMHAPYTVTHGGVALCTRQ